MVSRVTREDALNNGIRRRLLDRIQEEPGVHLAELIEHAEVGNGATRHHLRKLETLGLVEVHATRGYRRYFPVGRFSQEDIERRSVLKAGSNRRIYEVLKERSDATIRGIARMLDMSPSSVHRSVEMLRKSGLVDDGEHG